jgi:hypothetical protein
MWAAGWGELPSAGRPLPLWLCWCVLRRLAGWLAAWQLAGWRRGGRLAGWRRGGRLAGWRRGGRLAGWRRGGRLAAWQLVLKLCAALRTPSPSRTFSSWRWDFPSRWGHLYPVSARKSTRLDLRLVPVRKARLHAVFVRESTRMRCGRCPGARHV